MYSRKKHYVNFKKPSEPPFITKLKQQAGFIEGPSVDTKREKLPEIDDGELEDRDDEKPVVVVMKEGDLTSEEADLYTKIKKEVDTVGKADLSQKVIFKRKNNVNDNNSAESSQSKNVKKKKKEKPSKTVLSFNAEDDEDV